MSDSQRSPPVMTITISSSYAKTLVQLQAIAKYIGPAVPTITIIFNQPLATQYLQTRSPTIIISNEQQLAITNRPST